MLGKHDFGHRKAFTLIEVLIVVVIMAILAAVIIPQFSSATSDAKRSALEFNTHTLRSQIELYKVHHGSYPTISNNDLPQLWQATNAAGDVGTPGPSYPYGPYLTSGIPANPYNNSNKVVPVTTPGQTPTGAVAGGAGWQYDQTTGNIYPNNPEYFQ
ncbi:MAG: type II secretion system protein [Thermogutta sp.]